jgi:hypothetical protein
MEKSFQSTCFSHAFFKPCQYGTTKDFFGKSLKHIFIKLAQFNSQKCITWPKKFGKGKHEWNKTCIDSRICPRKLNNLLKTRCFFSYFIKIIVKDLVCKFAICFFKQETNHLLNIVQVCKQSNLVSRGFIISKGQCIML